MSGLDGFEAELMKDVSLSPTGPTTEPQMEGSKMTQENSSVEEIKKMADEEEEEEKEDVLKEEEELDDDGVEGEEEEEEEMTRSALLEPSTLPLSGDRKLQMHVAQGVCSEKGASEPEEKAAGINGGSQDLLEEQTQAEIDGKSKTKWRESMPEGERWRDDEIEVQDDKSINSVSNDDEEEEQGEMTWISEKSAMGFTPQVTIVHPSCKELPVESRHYMQKNFERELQTEPDSAVQFYPEWTEKDDKYYLSDVCSEKLRLALAVVAAGLLFPLLVWGGYALLPFDSPQLDSPPLRIVYTLRCAFFATIPIMLGVLVQGVARLRYSAVSPLYRTELVDRGVAVHWHYINESMGLFLFYFLQLAIMATYISQDLVKLVPLLTIIFVFGRLIYWLCLSLDSSIRGLGFGFSFFPILVMLGVNLYYVCSSVEEGAVFEVAPPTTAPPPPRQRWWW